MFDALKDIVADKKHLECIDKKVPVCTGGTGNLWMIYDVIDSTSKTPASLFVLDKKVVEKTLRKAPYHATTDELEELFKAYREGAHRLTKLQHPNILNVQAPLIETSRHLILRTERIFASVSCAICKDFADLYEHSHRAAPPSAVREFFLPNDAEVLYGLYQVANALGFLHDRVQLLHLNVAPSNMYITKSGDWKLAGLEFSVAAAPSTSGASSTPSGSWTRHFRALRSQQDLSTSRIVSALGPHLAYAAPEFVLQDLPHVPKSDAFSLGCCIFDIMYAARAYRLQNTTASVTATSHVVEPHHAMQWTCPCPAGCTNIFLPEVTEIGFGYIARYQHAVDGMHERTLMGGWSQEVSRTESSFLSAEAKETVLALTQRDPGRRSSLATCVASSPLFRSTVLRCLIFADRIYTEEEATKILFLKTLGSTLPHFSRRLLTMKVIPALIAELNQEGMCMHVIPVLLRCAPMLESKDVEMLIVPALSHILTVPRPGAKQALGNHHPAPNERSTAIAQLILEGFPSVVGKCTPATIDAKLVPFIQYHIRNNSDERIVKPILRTLEVHVVETQRIPAALFVSSLLADVANILTPAARASIQTRIDVLSFFRRILPVLDIPSVTKVETFLVHLVLTTEREPDVLMHAVSLYPILSDRVGTEDTLRKIIPSLCLLLLAPPLVRSHARSHAVITTVTGLLHRIDAERGRMDGARLDDDGRGEQEEEEDTHNAGKMHAASSAAAWKNVPDSATKKKSGGKGSIHADLGVHAFDRTLNVQEWQTPQPEPSTLPPVTPSGAGEGFESGDASWAKFDSKSEQSVFAMPFPLSSNSVDSSSSWFVPSMASPSMSTSSTLDRNGNCSYSPPNTTNPPNMAQAATDPPPPPPPPPSLWNESSSNTHNTTTNRIHDEGWCSMEIHFEPNPSSMPDSGLPAQLLHPHDAPSASHPVDATDFFRPDTTGWSSCATDFFSGVHSEEAPSFHPPSNPDAGTLDLSTGMTVRTRATRRRTDNGTSAVTPSSTEFDPFSGLF